MHKSHRAGRLLNSPNPIRTTENVDVTADLDVNDAFAWLALFHGYRPRESKHARLLFCFAHRGFPWDLFFDAD
jgi:hypothetical protein